MLYAIGIKCFKERKSKGKIFIKNFFVVVINIIKFGRKKFNYFWIILL